MIRGIDKAAKGKGDVKVADREFTEMDLPD
jgi:hypothetical protein